MRSKQVPSSPSYQSFFRLFEKIDQLLEEMIAQQQSKILQIAQHQIPHLTPEDLLNPHDFSPLNQDPYFNYEDGLATGLMAAQTALRALGRQLESQSPNSHSSEQTSLINEGYSSKTLTLPDHQEHAKL